jgi:hypothetical protein
MACVLPPSVLSGAARFPNAVSVPAGCIVSDGSGEIVRAELRGASGSVPIAERLVTPWDNHLATAALPDRQV